MSRIGRGGSINEEQEGEEAGRGYLRKGFGEERKERNR